MRQKADSGKCHKLAASRQPSLRRLPPECRELASHCRHQIAKDTIALQTVLSSPCFLIWQAVMLERRPISFRQGHRVARVLSYTFHSIFTRLWHTAIHRHTLLSRGYRLTKSCLAWSQSEQRICLGLTTLHFRSQNGTPGSSAMVQLFGQLDVIHALTRRDKCTNFVLGPVGAQRGMLSQCLSTGLQAPTSVSTRQGPEIGHDWPPLLDTLHCHFGDILRHGKAGELGHERIRCE